MSIGSEPHDQSRVVRINELTRQVYVNQSIAALLANSTILFEGNGTLALVVSVNIPALSVEALPNRPEFAPGGRGGGAEQILFF